MSRAKKPYFFEKIDLVKTPRELDALVARRLLPLGQTTGFGFAIPVVVFPALAKSIWRNRGAGEVL